MDWSLIPQIGTVGILALMIVEFGKNRWPETFRSDTNVWLSMFAAIVLTALHAKFIVGGDWVAVWESVPQGAMTGLTVSGLYRGIAGSSKKNAVDMSEQVNAHEIAGRIVGAGDEEDDEKAPIGFK